MLAETGSAAEEQHEAPSVVSQNENELNAWGQQKLVAHMRDVHDRFYANEDPFRAAVEEATNKPIEIVDSVVRQPGLSKMLGETRIEDAKWDYILEERLLIVAVELTFHFSPFQEACRSAECDEARSTFYYDLLARDFSTQRDGLWELEEGEAHWIASYVDGSSDNVPQNIERYIPKPDYYFQMQHINRYDSAQYVYSAQVPAEEAERLVKDLQFVTRYTPIQIQDRSTFCEEGDPVSFPSEYRVSDINACIFLATLQSIDLLNGDEILQRWE